MMATQTQQDVRKAEIDMQKELDNLRSELASMRDELSKVAKNGAAAMKESAVGAFDAAKDMTGAAREKLMEEAEALLTKLRAGAAGVADQVKETGVKAIGSVEHTIEERPVTSVLTALGVGFAIGWLVTKSK